MATASPPWLVKTPNTGVCALTHRRLHKCPLRTDHAPNRNRWAWVSVPNWHKTHHPGIQQPTNQNVHIPNAPAPTSSNIAFNKLVTTARLLHNKTSRNQNCKNTARALNKHGNMPMDKKLKPAAHPLERGLRTWD